MKRGGCVVERCLVEMMEEEDEENLAICFDVLFPRQYVLIESAMFFFCTLMAYV